MLTLFVRSVLLFAGLALGVFVGVLRVASEAERRPPRGATYDAIVVLGCRVNPSGEASHSLWRRAVTAAELYHAGHADCVVTTGGVGDHGASEASVAAEILVREGVPRERILLEDESTSTEENARFAKARFGGERMLVVTDGFHTLRARRTFERFFAEVDSVGTNAPWPRTRNLGALREVVALAGYAVLGRMRLEAEDTRNRSRREDVASESARRARAESPVHAPSPFSLGGPFGAAGFLVSCGFNETRRFHQRSNGPSGPNPRRGSRS